MRTRPQESPRVVATLVVTVLGTLAASALGASTLGACGPRASYTGNRYKSKEASFHVTAPRGGWKRLRKSHKEGGPDLAWHHRASHSTLSINSDCNQPDTPLKALTQHLLFGFTERAILSQQRQPMDGRESLHSHATGKLDGVPQHLRLVVLKKDECVYDLVLAAPNEKTLDRHTPTFNATVQSFATRN